MLAAALVLALAIGGRSQHHPLGDVPGRLILHGIRAGALPYLGWHSEYPVVVGIAQWVASWFGGTPLGFFLATSAFSTVLALALVRMLVHRSSSRVWHAILLPPFALYAFHNWDLLAIVPAVAGVLAFDDENDGWSGALIALGACAKVFPAVFLPPLVARRVHEGGWRAATPLVAGAGVTTVVLNVPFAATSARDWWYPYRFQSHRSITWGTLWSVPGRLPVVGHHLAIHAGGVANALSIAALIVATAGLCVLAVERRMSAVAVGAAATGLFLLANKVYSPNYDLWLVPWFALLPIAKRWRVAFAAFSATMFVVVFGFFHAGLSLTVVRATLPFVVVGRAVAIVAVIATAVAVSRTPPVPVPVPVPVGEAFGPR